MLPTQAIVFFFFKLRSVTYSFILSYFLINLLTFGTKLSDVLRFTLYLIHAVFLIDKI